MRALQLTGVGKVELVEIAEPHAGAGELLIKTGAGVICTSDLNDIRGNPFGIELPVILGHEGAGTVEAVGSGVKGFAVGDRVATHPVHPCGECENCRRGVGHLCERMKHFGINMQGVFAEKYVVRADRARKVAGGGKGMDFAVAALAEPVCVCLEAVAQAGVVKGSGKNVLVLGDGPFGVMIALLAKRTGAGRVVLAGEHDFRLGFAVRGGCEILNVMREQDRGAALGRVSRGGFDAVILAVGSAEAARQGLAVLRAKGKLVVFAAVHEPPPGAALNLFLVHMKELEILGACNDAERFDEAVGLLADERLGLAKVVTHRFKLEDFKEALELAAKGHERALKVAFEF